MTCPRCDAEIGKSSARCPHCGIQLHRRVSGMMKTSAILIASGQEQGFYRSVAEVPEPLRTRLQEVTTGENAGTIVIADQAGKEQITQVVARRDANRTAQAGPAQGETELPGAVRAPLTFRGLSWIAWSGIALALAALTVVAAVFRFRG